jgi:hypothetical protein
MCHRVKDLWAHNRYLLIAFVLAICLAGFFGVRSVSQFIYWSDPARQDQTLAGWMTPRYVGRSYDIPPEIVKEALGLPQQGAPRRVSLETLSEENGISLKEMQAQIDVAAARWRADQASGGK